MLYNIITHLIFNFSYRIGCRLAHFVAHKHKLYPRKRLTRMVIRNRFERCIENGSIAIDIDIERNFFSRRPLASCSCISRQACGIYSAICEIAFSFCLIMLHLDRLDGVEQQPAARIFCKVTAPGFFVVKLVFAGAPHPLCLVQFFLPADRLW